MTEKILLLSCFALCSSSAMEQKQELQEKIYIYNRCGLAKVSIECESFLGKFLYELQPAQSGYIDITDICEYDSMLWINDDKKKGFSFSPKSYTLLSIIPAEDGYGLLASFNDKLLGYVGKIGYPTKDMKYQEMSAIAMYWQLQNKP